MNKNWFHLLTSIAVVVWILKKDESTLVYFAPFLFVATSIYLLIDYLVRYLKDKSFVKRLKDFKKHLRSYKFYPRPVRIEEIDDLYKKFQILFGDDLLNKSELKKIHKKNNKCIWIVCQEFNNKNVKGRVEQVGFFEFFPIRADYSRKLLTNSDDGRTIRTKNINGSRSGKQFYLGSIGVLPEKKYNEKIYKAAVMKEFKEFLYILNSEKDITLYTRPVTDDGIRLVDKYGFIKTDKNCDDSDCVWHLSLNKDQIKYDRSGRLRF